MPSRLDTNFDFVRGDLLYGFDEPRGRVIRESYTLQLAKLYKYWVIANDFNNSTVLHFDFFYDPNEKRPDNETFKQEIVDYLAQQYGLYRPDNPDTLNDPSRSEPAWGTGKPRDKVKDFQRRAGKFFQALRQHPRYNPETVRSLADDAQAFRKKGDSRQFAMIRKSCKFGLEYVTQILPTGAMIHFILDQKMADWKAGSGPDPALGIAQKTKYPTRQGALRVPITASELRWLFRNWPDVSSRVTFYDPAGNTTQAPWVKAPETWRPYAQERKAHYMKKARPAILAGIGNEPGENAPLDQINAYVNRIKKRLNEPDAERGH